MVNDRERVKLLTEMAEVGKVYAVLCGPATEDGYKDMLVCFPSKLGAYWLVRGKVSEGDLEVLPDCAGQRRTWVQADKALALQLVPDFGSAPQPKPEGMPIFRWLGDVPMIWFANARRYSG